MNIWQYTSCDTTSVADAPPYVEPTSANAIFKSETFFFLHLITTTLPTKTDTTIETPHIITMASCSNPTHKEMDQALIWNNSVHTSVTRENNKSGSICEPRNQEFKEDIVKLWYRKVEIIE
jgi:hypothetical protein